MTKVQLKLQNYTARPRSYTILAQWPEGKAKMIDNERGGRKETNGLWAWKIETLDPGVSALIEYSLEGLEKGDWKETEVFYRGSGDIIGANRLDEKILEELRRQDDDSYETDIIEEQNSSDSKNGISDDGVKGWSSNGTGQQTLGV